MTPSEVKEILRPEFRCVSYSRKNNTFTAKQSYYWGIVKSGEVQANYIKQLLPNAEIIDYGNHFAPFSGGAKTGSAKDSYYWVTFKIIKKEK